MRLVSIACLLLAQGCGSVDRSDADSDADSDSDSDSDVDADSDADSDSDTDSDSDPAEYCWPFGLWASDCYPSVYTAVEASDLCECTVCLAAPGVPQEYYECVTGLGCLDVGAADECLDGVIASHPPNEDAQELDRQCRDRHDECAKSEAWGGWGANPDEFDCTAMVMMNEESAAAALPCIEEACNEVRLCLVQAANDVCGCNFQPPLADDAG